MSSLKSQIQHTKATDFKKSVWLALLQIPRGTVVTYADIAMQIGRPKAVRAVGTAVGANPFAPAVPCHRVIRSDGKIGNYSGHGGVPKKRELLKTEGVTL